MLEKILSLDQELFICLNGLGSESYDGFWLFITKQINWVPFFLLLFYLVYKKLGAKQTLFLILFVSLLVTVTDQTTNLVKNAVQRLRPCNNSELTTVIRIVQSRSSYSFFSGHASNTMAVTTFLYLIMKRHYSYFWLLFLWPLVFAYSRIYLGLHYPIDIICGYLCGIMIGFLIFKVYQAAQKKYFPLRA